MKIFLAIMLLSIVASAQIINGGSGAGGGAFSGISTGTNTNATMVTGTGSTLSPSGTGQLAASADWYQSGPGVISPEQPTMAVNITGGTIVTGVQVFTKITYVGLAVIEPSAELRSATTAACTGGTQCSVTVTMPTTCTAGNLPSGVTGCTVWSSNSTGTEKQQAASAACVNITSATCVIGTVGAGSSLVTPSTTGILPTGAQTNTCPDNIIPTNWYQKGDNNYYPLAGLDVSALNSLTQPAGVFTFCDHVFFNDSSVQPLFANTFITMHHQAGTRTATNNQDRTLALSLSMNANDATTHYGLEDLQAELDFHCNGCTINGSPDGEVSVASLQLADLAEANYTIPVGGSDVIRAQYFKNGAGTATGGSMESVRSLYAFNNAAAVPAGTQAALFSGWCFNSVGGAIANHSCMGFKFNPVAGSTNRFSNGQIALYEPSGITPGANDLFLRNDTPTLPSIINGQVVMGSITSNSVAAMTYSAAANLNGSLTLPATVTPQPSAVSCTTGASTYSYIFVGVDSNGGQSLSATSNSPGTCLNPLTSGNPATVGVTNSTTTETQYGQFVRIDVYRTAGPMGLGKVGSLTCAAAVSALGPTCSAFSDTGIAATGTVPTVNTSGTVTAAGFLNASANKGSLAADQVLNADTALHSINQLTFTVSPSGAQTYNFHCALAYSQATAAVANAFGIQVVTANPTNVFAVGNVQTNTTAFTGGTLATLATTTATNIVSFTPGATATVLTAFLDGTVELAAGQNTINLMALTGAAADALTIKRGSYCELK